jgi:hypothetical protein
MTRVDLKDLARRGAAVRAAELRQELADLYRAFPSLRKEALDDPFTRRGPRASYTDDGTTILTSGKRRKRKGMSAAQKKAVSVRMKAYWAKRRASR